MQVTISSFYSSQILFKGPVGSWLALKSWLWTFFQCIVPWHFVSISNNLWKKVSQLWLSFGPALDPSWAGFRLALEWLWTCFEPTFLSVLLLILLFVSISINWWKKDFLLSSKFHGSFVIDTCSSESLSGTDLQLITDTHPPTIWVQGDTVS